MPDTVRVLLQSLLSRILALWVKPDVLPGDPTGLINPDIPVLYVLEVGGAADRTALQIVCRKHGLPNPDQPLIYGSVRESSSVDVLRRRQGIIFRQHRNVISRRLGRLVAAGAHSSDTTDPDVDRDDTSDELQIVPVAVYWGRAPEKESSIWRLWFTENWQFAGRTRKLFTTLLHGRYTLLSISEPLSFNTLRNSGENSEILQRKLSRILRVHFRQRRIATLGPDQSHKRMLVDHVMSDPSVRQAISEEANVKSGERTHSKTQCGPHYGPGNGPKSTLMK